MRRVLAVATALGVVLGGVCVTSAAQAIPVDGARAIPGAATAALVAPMADTSATALAVGDAAAAKAATSTIKWGACADAELKEAKAQCGYLSVPLDYSHPTKTKIKIAVSRIKHTVPAKKFQGIMLVNPGGPGGSGLTLSTLGQYVPKDAGKAYDWIGFDPRGVAASKPALACNPKYFGYKRPYYVPTRPALEAAWLKRAKGYAAACDKAGGKLLDHLKTTDTIKDMESIRKALKAKKINFYGFSYGTYLGQVYSTTYPTQVRRMVLDGNIDPRKIWYQGNLDQGTAFDRNIKVFFAWVAKHDSIYHLGTTAEAVEALYYSEQQKLLRAPAGGVIGADEWNDLFVPAGYGVFGWDELAKAFSGWVNNGDAKTLKAMFDNSYPTNKGADNGYAVYLGVQCTDVQWPKSFNKWRADNTAIHAVAPFLTWGNAWYNAPCLSWGAKAAKPVTVNGKKAPAILLISETLDAATPYEGSLEVRSRFPKSVLIEGVNGTTHSASLNGVACVDNTIADYLLTGKLPKRLPGRVSDKKCDAFPQPEPAKVQPAAELGRAQLQELIIGQ